MAMVWFRDVEDLSGIEKRREGTLACRIKTRVAVEWFLELEMGRKMYRKPKIAALDPQQGCLRWLDSTAFFPFKKIEGAMRRSWQLAKVDLLAALA